MERPAADDWQGGQQEHGLGCQSESHLTLQARVASAPATLAMLSPLRANHLVARIRSLPLRHTRNFASASDGLKRKRGRAPKSAKVASEEASKPLLTPSDVSEAGYSLATSLDHYTSLPPLPPIEDWHSHFPYASPSLRDRISLRAPVSAIRVAHSFVNSKKTSTGNPKVVIEAFPGA